MTLHEIIAKNRSYRRFREERRITRETLEGLVELARLSPSGRNRQGLKFRLVWEAEKCAALFPMLSWAAALKDWPGPAEGERPAAYIVMLRDKALGAPLSQDEGIAAQSIMLGAAEAGLGGCMLGSVDRARAMAALGLGEEYEIALVLALGEPGETVVIDPMPESGDVSYWRDAASVHHVPKRSLAELIV